MLCLEFRSFRGILGAHSHCIASACGAHLPLVTDAACRSFCSLCSRSKLSAACTPAPSTLRIKIAGSIMPFSASNAYILVVAGKSRRYGMVPAQIPVLLTQKPSTENGINRAATLFLAWPPQVGWPSWAPPIIQPIPAQHHAHVHFKKRRV